MDYDEQPPEESPEEQDSILVHEAYLQHRLSGGEPATPEAYMRAVEQFERLPGAVRTGSSAGRTIPPRRPPADAQPAPEPEESGDQGGEPEESGEHRSGS